jgi:hypothetical protein
MQISATAAPVANIKGLKGRRRARHVKRIVLSLACSGMAAVAPTKASVPSAWPESTRRSLTAMYAQIALQALSNQTPACMHV